MTRQPTPVRLAPDTPGYSQAAFLAEVGRRTVAESAPAVEAPADPAVAEPQRIVVREADTSGATVTKPGRLALRLIRAGWSLNGNLYPAEVLRRDGAAAWPAGTLCYVDHATDEEEAARPAGSVRNLAAVTTTAARWDEGEQALMAEARLFAPWREAITDMADTIGMSIRAWVTGEHGERDGRSGFIVQSIPEGRSVDFVTVPAAGGGIVSVLEAVGNEVPVKEARNAGHWLEARIHGHFSQLADEMFGEGHLTREERIALSAAVGDGLAAFAARIEAEAPHLYERDPFDQPPTPQLAAADEAQSPAAPQTAQAEEATPETPDATSPALDAPAAPAAPNPVTDGGTPTAPNPPNKEEPAMSGTATGTPPAEAGTAPVVDTAPTTTAEQAQPDTRTVAALEAVTAQLAAMQQQLTQVQASAAAQESENRAMRNRSHATEAVTAALRAPEHADVATQISARVTARILGDVPTTAEGAVDTTALGDRITATIADEAAYVRQARADALEAAGVGQPYGLGASQRQESTQDDGFDAELKTFFGDTLGLTEAQASIASKGRG